MQKIQRFLRQEPVLLISFLLAVASCFFIPPDMEYLDYIDKNTILILFCLMVVLAGLKELGLFQYIGDIVLRKIKTERSVIFVLVSLCFFGSMAITNDVALITFVPLAILILTMADMVSSLCFTVVLMTIAANLGSMLTPIGNPQNLYLYSVSGISLIEFMGITLPYTLLSAVLLAVCIWFGYKKKTVTIHTDDAKTKIDRKKLLFFMLLFILCLLSVIDLLPVEILFAVILLAVLLENRKLLWQVDYSLLATFIFFFIFIGNMGRFPAFSAYIVRILNDHERLVSVGISQIINNVPAALLLSGFTGEWKELIIGTNIGGLGTIIASMASLISYKQIALQYPKSKMRYLLLFTVWNLVFLAVLLLLP